MSNSFYFLKGSKYWKAESVKGSLTIATDKEYPKEGRDVFVDFFGCKAQKKGAKGALNLVSVSTSLAPAFTSAQNWKLTCKSYADAIDP